MREIIVTGIVEISYTKYCDCDLCQGHTGWYERKVVFEIEADTDIPAFLEWIADDAFLDAGYLCSDDESYVWKAGPFFDGYELPEEYFMRKIGAPALFDI